MYTNEKSQPYRIGFLTIQEGRRPTLPHCIAVPSARTGLTSLFGMGRGDPRRYNHPKYGYWTKATDFVYAYVFVFAFVLVYRNLQTESISYLSSRKVSGN